MMQCIVLHKRKIDPPNNGKIYFLGLVLDLYLQADPFKVCLQNIIKHKFRL